MKAFIRNFLAAMLAIIVIIGVTAGGIKIKLSKKPKIKDHSYLVVDIYGEILEYAPPGGGVTAMLGAKPETLNRIITNLEKASVDDRIEGVIFKISGTNTAGLAMIQEMRDAITKVRASGKKVYAFSDYLDRNSLYLASACDSIYMPETGYLFFTGAALTSMHVRGALEKLGIKPNLHRIKDYKGAAELLTRKNLSRPVRENYQWLLDDIWEMELGSLSEERGIAREKLVESMKHALFTVEEAKEAGLIDDMLYWQELEKKLKRDKDKKLRIVSQRRYAKEKPEKFGLKGKKKIAVVHAQGMIAGRKSEINPFFGIVMGHESVVADLRKARFDEDVAAVVFRVESGGGEGLASALIAHEIEILGKVKPVVASMVDVAASGGYYISYCATKIMADPATITGSIGSISLKFNTKGFNDKLGITHDHVTKGPMALLFSSHRDFTPEERKRFEENHWDGFNLWLADVAKHRGMTFEDAEKLAHGRVWTGHQAKENGLIDEVGGLYDAIELAKSLADIPGEEKVTVLHYPKAKGFIGEILGGGSVATAFKWMMYRFLHNNLDFAESLSSGRMSLADEIVIH